MTKKDTILATLNQLKGYLIAALLGIIVAYAIKFIIDPTIVNGSSMSPTFESGDILKTERYISPADLHYGDIVTFIYNKKRYIKRIVALPNDTIVVKNGILYINNTISDFQFDLIENGGIIEEPITLSSDEYFCIGDNRNNSIDCRSIGPITFDLIERKIIGKY